MKTIELTEKQYKVLLDFKNYVTFKTRDITNPDILKHMVDITNPDILKHMVDITDPDWKEKIKKRHGIPKKAWTTIDFEPAYLCGECITDAILCIWDEQEKGEVNCIT